jgi:hypothetical protein
MSYGHCTNRYRASALRFARLRCARCKLTFKNVLAKQRHVSRCIPTDQPSNAHIPDEDDAVLDDSGDESRHDGRDHGRERREDEDSYEELANVLRQRAQSQPHNSFLRDQIENALKTAELFGNDRCSVEIINWIMDNKVNKEAADGLMKLLNKHGINHGRGMATEVNSMYKVHPCCSCMGTWGHWQC